MSHYNRAFSPSPQPVTRTAFASTNTAAFAWPVRVYWEDTDAGGIVYHASYVRFMERARTEWLRSKGLSQSQAREKAGGLFVVSQMSLRYLLPARLDDVLHTTCEPLESGRASMTLRQCVWRMPGETPENTPTAENPADSAAPAPVLLCEGEVKVGWVDATHLRPARIPDHVRTLFT